MALFLVALSPVSGHDSCFLYWVLPEVFSCGSALLAGFRHCDASVRFPHAVNELEGSEAWFSVASKRVPPP